MAIIICECIDEIQKDLSFQVYATDIDEDTINWARRGYYSSSIATDVSKERLKRFFSRKALEEILPNNNVLEGFEVEHEFPIVGHLKFRLNARRLTGQQDGSDRILLVMEDCTGNGQKI